MRRVYLGRHNILFNSVRLFFRFIVIYGQCASWNLRVYVRFNISAEISRNSAGPTRTHSSYISPAHPIFMFQIISKAGIMFVRPTSETSWLLYFPFPRFHTYMQRYKCNSKANFVCTVGSPHACYKSEHYP